MKRSRTTVWLVLAGICVALLVAYLLCVPFMRGVGFIDRKTGLMSVEIRWLGVYTEHRLVAVPVRGNPALHPEWSRLLTAAEKKIPYGSGSLRFPWSGPHDEELQPGIGYQHALAQLFFFDRFNGKEVTDDELDAIVRRRILIWNSPALDLDPQAVADQAQAENERP